MSWTAVQLGCALSLLEVSVRWCEAGLDAIPEWLSYSDAELAEAVAANSKQKPNQTKKELAAMAGLLPKVGNPA